MLGARIGGKKWSILYFTRILKIQCIEVLNLVGEDWPTEPAITAEVQLVKTTVFGWARPEKNSAQ